MDRPDYKYFIDKQEEKQSQKIFYKFVVVLFIVYAFIFGIVFAYHANFEYVTINGCSMQPTLNVNPKYVDGDEVEDGVYIKLTHNVDYGDIIVINKTEEDSIIKRALAFGGDYVTIASINYDGNRDYRFMRIKEGSGEIEIINEDYILSYEEWNSKQGEIVNNVEYENILYTMFTYLDYQTKTFNLMLDGVQRDVVFFQIPEGDVFFMGDNRTGSFDARASGTTSQKNILGYVVKVVYEGTFIKEDPIKWTFQQIKDFFSIIWEEILIFFGSNS